MLKFLNHHILRNQTIGYRAPLGSFKRNWLKVIRCLLASVTLMAPASMVTAVSCGLNCNARCEHRSGPLLCISLPASSCLNGGDYPCTVVTGCYCGTITDPKVGCNINACAGAADQAACAATIGACEWGETCRDLIDCHSLDSQSACNANDHQCYWSEDCG